MKYLIKLVKKADPKGIFWTGQITCYYDWSAGTFVIDRRRLTDRKKCLYSTFEDAEKELKRLKMFYSFNMKIVEV